MDDDNIEANYSIPPQTEESHAGDEPIILGDAPNDFVGDFASPPGDFAAPPSEQSPDPQYLGEVVSDDISGAPIILGGEEEPAEPPEPSPMQKWNEQWTETLKQRKDEENTIKAEYSEAARVEMEKFNAERELKRQGKMTKNREDEQAKLEAIEADLENDNSWQRVCKLVELNMDGEKGGDVKRMIDTLIALKNDPSQAATLA
mmetsp:Transcript_12279/g.16074  ORF Transcript_12279/g.16074 Transcript_12279/m.16074 type:complete len:203 (+) Transcript_12279:98-706(+)|eukprot:CAMPEP_0198148860 /NCGR_PEP_ID=MMETSP1443-20131203/43773_1 /TAXON_ID=186043 /ORGANISM="Entomoneis sp., Strain CCMP2396" /LENGTH=202 /DNA_ID=CAMNT_0043813707 /DNA_START=59 /DNA_END=667 /DNA_ORIENTATION=+